MIVFYILALAILAGANVFDIQMTMAGLKRGKAVEGNESIRFFFGPKPSAAQLYLYDGSIFAAIVLATIFVPRIWQLEAVPPAVALAAAARHVQGGLKWRKYL